MKRLLNILLIISITLMAVLFATLNDTRVVLNLLFWQPTEQSLASWLLISFLLGLCIGGLLVYLNMWFSLRRKIRFAAPATEPSPRQRGRTDKAATRSGVAGGYCS